MPKILLIEDNEMNRDMFSRRLRRKGLLSGAGAGRPERYGDGPNPSTGVSFDGSEPGRARRLGSDAPSRPAMSRDREKHSTQACDDYDIKPVELLRLLGKIEALLKGGGMAAAVEPH
jgi:two-component system cell cycle response regulator DivK